MLEKQSQSRKKTQFKLLLNEYGDGDKDEQKESS